MECGLTCVLCAQCSSPAAGGTSPCRTISPLETAPSVVSVWTLSLCSLLLPLLLLLRRLRLRLLRLLRLLLLLLPLPLPLPLLQLLLLRLQLLLQLLLLHLLLLLLLHLLLLLLLLLLPLSLLHTLPCVSMRQGNEAESSAVAPAVAIYQHTSLKTRGVERWISRGVFKRLVC